MLKGALDETGKGGEVGVEEFVSDASAQVEHDGIDLRFGPEDVRGEGCDFPNFCERLGNDGDGTVGGRVRGSGEALADLALDGYGKAGADGGLQAEQVDEEWRGDLVGQVGDEFELGRFARGAAVEFVEEIGVEFVFAPEYVGRDEVEARVVMEEIGEQGLQAVIDFDGDDAGSAVEEDFGKGAGAGANFEDEVFGGEVGGVDEFAHEVEVDEEVLAEAMSRGEFGLGKQVADG